MIDDKLKVELTKKNCRNLGLVPGNNFGKAGITEEPFIIDYSITTLDENGNKEKFPVYIGEIKGSTNTLKIASTALSINNPGEFYIIYSKNDIITGMNIIYDLDSKEDFGEFLLLNNNEWIYLDFLKQLSVVASLELITQQGILWSPCKDYGNLIQHLESLIEFSS